MNTTAPALRRKIARLEAQLAALKDFLTRNHEAEYATIRRNADLRMRIDQAQKILSGEDE